MQASSNSSSTSKLNLKWYWLTNLLDISDNQINVADTTWVNFDCGTQRDEHMHEL